MENLKSWFTENFVGDLPQDLDEFLLERPDGAISESGSLFGPDDIMAYTEERELVEKGLLCLGTGNMLDVFLLRVADGSVILVDQTDFQAVDATFRSLTTLRNLLNLQ